MAANGGGEGPPFIGSTSSGVVKKEEQYDPQPNVVVVENNQTENSNKGISIAERRAATCGFNASNINAASFKTTGLVAPQARLTIPPGISPSALLDSPIMLPNAQAQLSPTTGTFQFPSPNHESLKLKLQLAGNGDNAINAMESSSSSKAEAHEGFPHSAPNNLRVENKPFEEFECPRDLQEMTNKDCFEDTLLPKTEVECLSLQPSDSTRNQMFPHNDQSGKERNQEKHQKGAYFPKEVMAKCAEDGFYWRKYGQKHVKGSEYPRSYYKCTNTNCPVKKKVERSQDGEITEIVYRGSHNHPQPHPFKRFSDQMPEISTEGSGLCSKMSEAGKDFAFSSDWRPDHNVDGGPISTSFLSDFSHDPITRSINTFEPVDDQAQELPSTNSGNQDCDIDQNLASPESISFNDEDDENGEYETKKRKRDSFPSETTAPRSTREPRVVVQIESDVDILDDGYRWRKYGQKVVKGNPNPRSYYKCTTSGCPVRKHVERAANDIKSVITTYEGKHNHEVPSSKTGNLVISDVASLPPAVTNSTVSNPIPSPMAQKLDMPKAGKQVQDLPLYLNRKPFLNYNELMMRSTLPGNFSNDLNFGAASVYPLPFPPFHSLPYGSLLMNNNHIKTYPPATNLYPMLPDYMSQLPSQIINHVPAGSANMPVAGNFHFNNHAPLQTSTQGQEIKECHAKIVKPKEEQRDIDGELYDTCLSLPNRGNGTI